MAKSRTIESQNLEAIERQRLFYQNKVSNKRSLNPAMYAWERCRKNAYAMWASIEVFNSVYSLHRNWLGNLKGKRVLDLGCYTGNVLSVEIAKKADFYLGIDLSEAALRVLKQKMEKAGVMNANLKAVDFLSDRFGSEQFDIIYANAVLHHFENFEFAMSMLSSRLLPDGRVVSFDPLGTAFFVKLVRKVYRPFQTNALWEWPFKKNNFDIVKKYFKIEAIQGVAGLSKWVLPLAVSPFFKKEFVEYGKKLHARDMATAKRLDTKLWRCMSVNMHLKKKNIRIEK